MSSTVQRIGTKGDEDLFNAEDAISKHMATLLEEMDSAEKQGNEQLYLEKVREYFTFLRRNLEILE